MALFKIDHAGPLVTVQDQGRAGHMRFGVTPSGPMDRMAFDMAHFGLNQTSGPAIEISLGGLSLTCVEGSVTACITGGSFNVILNGKQIAPWSVFTLEQGGKLAVRPGDWGSWGYLAFAGELDVPTWLHSASTIMGADLCGAPLQTGGTVRVQDTRVWGDRTVNMFDPQCLKPISEIRVVLGPQDRHFPQSAIDDLKSEPFRLTADFNRQGVRLQGPKLEITSALDMPSEPIARGSLQVSGSGDPVCLLADHQTTGGYPKIATVISADQDKIAQMRSGDTVHFKVVDVETAVHAAKDMQKLREKSRGYIEATRMTLDQKLWASNLVSGVIDDNKD